MSGPDQDEKGQPATVKTTTELPKTLDTATAYVHENNIEVKLHFDLSRFDTRIVPRPGTDPLIGDFNVVNFASLISPVLGSFVADGLVNRAQLNDPEYRAQQIFNNMGRQGSGLAAFNTDASLSDTIKGIPGIGDLGISMGVAINNSDHITHGVSVKVPTTFVFGAKVDF